MAKAPSHDVRLSKSLSKILRHDAKKLGLDMKPDGYVLACDILSKTWLSKQSYTEDSVLRVVADNDKQRFSVRRDAQGRLEIRANQGHSLQCEELELRRIEDPGEFTDIVHGTSWKNWQIIRNDGLRIMNRTHVHFAPGVLGDEGVISGMRRNCDILIYINMAKAMADGLEFYLSSNRVILCSGDTDHVLRPKYFLKVVDRKKHTETHLPS